MKTQSTDSSTSFVHRVERIGRLPLVRLVGLLAVALLYAKLLGRLTVHYVNDSASYIDYPFDSLSEALLSIRTPGYPIFLSCVTWTCGMEYVPVVQVVVHALAAWLLGNELLERTGRIWVATVASLAVLFGCTFTDHVHTISTDSIGLSAGVFCFTFLLRSTRIGGIGNFLATSVFASTAIFLRPAYLFLIPWIFLAGWLIAGIDRDSDAMRYRRTCLLMSASIATVVFGWMTLRLFVVNDFAVLPFGHQNLSGITAQLISKDEMRTLATEKEDGLLTTLMLDVAKRLDSGAYETPTTQGLATLTIESQWDDINYRVVWPAAREVIGEAGDLDRSTSAAVHEHRLIGDMNAAIVKKYPERYLRWILLAGRRAVWGTAANLAMQPVFLIALFAVLGRWMVSLLSDPTRLSLEATRGWNAFCFAGISFWLLKTGFVILSSPPLGRFADAGAVFLPAIFFGSLLLAKRERLKEA